VNDQTIKHGRNDQYGSHRLTWKPRKSSGARRRAARRTPLDAGVEQKAPHTDLLPSLPVPSSMGFTVVRSLSLLTGNASVWVAFSNFCRFEKSMTVTDASSPLSHADLFCDCGGVAAIVAGVEGRRRRHPGIAAVRPTLTNWHVMVVRSITTHDTNKSYS
jgi:hypothetical protein